MDVEKVQQRLTITRMESAAGGGGGAAGVGTTITGKDQEYFHRKLRQFTRTEAQHAVQQKEREEQYVCQQLELSAVMDENSLLNDNLDSLREVTVVF